MAGTSSYKGLSLHRKEKKGVRFEAQRDAGMAGKARHSFPPYYYHLTSGETEAKRPIEDSRPAKGSTVA